MTTLPCFLNDVNSQSKMIGSKRDSGVISGAKKTNHLQSMAYKALWQDMAAALILTILAVWLFRGHVSGDSLWIGNPDRLNSDLKILRHYLSTQGGAIPAWNEHEMMGYDSLALPYTFPNPLVYLINWFGRANLYVIMGYVGIAMLSAAGMVAYAFLRTFLPAGLPVLVGAICYEFSSLTLLKVSQNSMSFAVFIVIPLLMLAIRHTRRDTAAWCFLVLALLLGCMMNLMFLQKAAYAVMLAGAYCAWRSYSERSWRPALVFGLALVVAMAFSFPRIIGVATAIGEYARTIAGMDLRNFNVLYDFQNIRPYEILRWFDDSIFGRNPSQTHNIGNNINLTEGFLLYTSAVVPFLLVAGLVRQPRQWLKLWGASRSETAFFFWMLIGCIAVVVFKPVAHAVFLLFLRMDFTHARILIAGLLPLVVLVALALTDFVPSNYPENRNFKIDAAGLAVGLLLALAIDAIAVQFLGTLSFACLANINPGVFNLSQEALVWFGLYSVLYLLLLRTTLAGMNIRASSLAIGLLAVLTIAFIAGQFPIKPSFQCLSSVQLEAPNLRIEALVRIGLSVALFLLLLRATLVGNTHLRRGAYVSICALLASQCLLAANQQVNGPQVFNLNRPFSFGDFYQARRAEFLPPSTEQLQALHQRIEPQRYRVALVCDKNIADGFCAGHVPEFWQLRAIDGYYGLGVPTRLRDLPWPTGVSLRTISFTSIDAVPWALLGLLNVRSVLVASDGVFRNIVRDGDSITGHPDPATFEIVTSPARVTPRAFFAAAVQPALSAKDAARLLFRPEGIIDPTLTSFVEGLGQARSFEDGSAIDLRGRDDTLELRFEVSNSERFLVLNELYHPGWSAEINGRTLPIMPTNIVMRGVLVPPGTDHVRFHYTTYTAKPSAWKFQGIALFATLILFFGLRRDAKA